jgi:preprotein translocase SecE subunit
VEHKRSVAFVFALAALAVGYLAYLVGAEIVVPRMALGDSSVAPAAAGVAVGLLTFVVGLRNEVWTSFVDSVVAELLEVTWPTREETTRNTFVVVVSTVVFASVLFVLAKAAEIVTRSFLYPPVS